MPATLIFAQPLSTAAASPADLDGNQNAAPVITPSVAPALDSSALLQGQKAVTISHNGATYRLQSTKLGKLILTK